ncbi:MAG: radical SAM protein [Acidobacteria bacterium]|nr:radical SAM protein [Acidobacteriota bacterium]
MEKKRLMRARWESLDPRWRTLGQGLGQQATGCGATIGVHPRCDFACTGCYLGAEANRVRPIALDQTLRQLDQLRAWLGPKGNVQITDGEVTLLPAGDLVAMLRYARRIGLIPMVMTHGDTFRRQPGLLERLMTEGGLTEVSIHIDITQRGRLGYKAPRSEEALTPLREECAGMIRAARRRTRLPLRAAMTLTITRDSLDDVPHVVEWCLLNRDVFGMLSFQPVAQVGRTQPGLPGVTVSELWDRIEVVLARYGLTRRGPGALTFGHPDCTRLELLGVYERAGGSPRLFTIVRDGYEADAEMMRAFFRRGLGGLNFRDDTSLERVCRAAGILLTDPRWVLGPLRRWILERVAGVGTTAPRLVWDRVRGRVSIDSFCVVSHHFMDAAELASDTGQERLSACLFRVPVGGEMVSMCRVNAGGLRDAVYERPTERATFALAVRRPSAESGIDRRRG